MKLSLAINQVYSDCSTVVAEDTTIYGQDGDPIRSVLAVLLFIEKGGIVPSEDTPIEKTFPADAVSWNIPTKEDGYYLLYQIAANLWNSSTVYEVGQVVYYDGNLYEATSSIGANVDPPNTLWKKVTYRDVLGNTDISLNVDGFVTVCNLKVKAAKILLSNGCNCSKKEEKVYNRLMLKIDQARILEAQCLPREAEKIVQTASTHIDAELE